MHGNPPCLRRDDTLNRSPPRETLVEPTMWKRHHPLFLVSGSGGPGHTESACAALIVLACRACRHYR